MPKEKPSFDTPGAPPQEGGGWVYRSGGDGAADASGASQTPKPSPPDFLSRMDRRAARAADAITFPFALVTMIVLLPFARFGAWWRR